MIKQGGGRPWRSNVHAGTPGQLDLHALLLPFAGPVSLRERHVLRGGGGAVLVSLGAARGPVPSGRVRG